MAFGCVDECHAHATRGSYSRSSRQTQALHASSSLHTSRLLNHTCARRCGRGTRHRAGGCMSQHLYAHLSAFPFAFAPRLVHRNVSYGIRARVSMRASVHAHQPSRPAHATSRKAKQRGRARRRERKDGARAHPRQRPRQHKGAATLVPQQPRHLGSDQGSSQAPLLGMPHLANLTLHLVPMAHHVHGTNSCAAPH